MNVRIAKLHKASRQLVGMFITIMGYLSIAVSATTIAIGAMLFGYSRIYNNDVGKYVGTTVFLLIGAAIGVVIEGLTTSNCAALRKKLVEQKGMREAHSKVEDKTDVIKALKQGQKRSMNNAITLLVLSIIVSSSISILGGTLFWHFVLGGMSDVVMSWLVSTSFSAVISIALIISELRKGTNDELVQEALSTMAMIKEAYNADMQEMMLERLQRTVKTRLKTESNEGEIFEDAANQQAFSILDGLIGSGNGTLKGLLEEKRREREEYQIDALNQLSTTNTEKLPVIDLGNAPKYRADKAAKMKKVKDMVAKKSWEYVYNNADEISDKIEVGKSTLYRYLDELKQEVSVQS